MIRKWLSRDGGLLLVVLLGLAIVVGLSRQIDHARPPIDATLEEEQLYLTGSTAKRMSLGFNGLAADWYWMRSLQYVGRKVMNASERFQLDNLNHLNLKLLAPLLDTATTLDPEFMEPYEYAAVVLPVINVDDAVRIIKKGIAANPSSWRLYQHLGYINWQQKDFKEAGDAYRRGAELPGAPAWMRLMQARMAGEGSSRDTAREIYLRMYEQAGDEQIRTTARRHLLYLDSLDQKETLRKVLSAYQARIGHCPLSWKEIEPALRVLRLRLDSQGAPLDPSGIAYVLVTAKCDIELGPKTEVPSF
jgi:tetratricopeptide (TPR) repeat protein